MIFLIAAISGASVVLFWAVLRLSWRENGRLTRELEEWKQGRRVAVRINGVLTEARSDGQHLPEGTLRVEARP